MRGISLMVTASLVAWTCSIPVRAQEAPSSQSAEEMGVADNSGIQEIVVTANRRSQNLQDVPISIAAFTGDTLKTQGIESVTDLPNITPGLTLTRTIAGANSFLRGVGTTTAGYTTESPVAVYLDGVYLPNAAAAAFNFNNIERIEVLKGPQGTLYGRNTTGGLIHIITRAPSTAEAQLDVSASYGNYDTTKFDFYGSTPVSDTLAANLSVTYTNQADGWGRNLFLDTDAYKYKDFGAQGKLQWEPGSDTTVTLQGFYDRTKSDLNGYATYPGSIGSDGSGYLGEFTLSTREQPYVIQRQALASLKIEHDVGFATLNAISAYMNNRSPSLTLSGYLGNPVTGQAAVSLYALQQAETYSQEINLSSNPSGSPLKWIVGLFYYHDSTKVQSDVYATCIATLCAAKPPPVRTTGHQGTESYSIYGEGEYSFSPETRLTLGLRFTSDSKDLDGLMEPLAGRPNSFPAFPPGSIISPDQAIDTSKTFNELTWRAVLAHDLADDMHAYASYSRGFKSGGYNLISFTNPASAPETLDAYEIGLKSELADNMLRLNLSAFYYDYRDIQMRSAAPPAPPGGSILFNAASAHIKGVDVDFLLAPAEGLTFNGGFEVLDAEYSSFPGGLCSSPATIGGPILGGTITTTCDLAGNDLPNAPKFSYSLGATYVLQTSAGEVTFNASDNYKSSFSWEADNRLKQGKYHLVNASVTWAVGESGLSLRTYVRNLFDKYYLSAAAVSLGADVYSPGAPRTYGVTARYQF